MRPRNGSACSSISPAASITAIPTCFPHQVNLRRCCAKHRFADSTMDASFYHVLMSPGPVLSLTCALMLLNTDLHGQVGVKCDIQKIRWRLEVF